MDTVPGNIPVRREMGAQIRQAFLPEQGWKLLTADYSQVELRLLAHFCGDPVLCEAFANGIDIHAAVACEIFNVAAHDVSAEQRRIAAMLKLEDEFRQDGMKVAPARTVFTSKRGRRSLLHGRPGRGR